MKITIESGRAIRKARLNAELSQMDLELAIGAAFGSISRLESGKVNPTKETLISIAYALKLDTYETARLFGIDLYNPLHLFEQTTSMLVCSDLQKVLDLSVNDLIFSMGYLASCVFLVDIKKEYISLAALTNSNISSRVQQFLQKPLSALRLSIEHDRKNLLVKCINENAVLTTLLSRDYLVPAVLSEEADMLQKLTGDKNHLIVPLSNDNSSFGAMVYIKKVDKQFSDDEIKLNTIITKQLAIAIHRLRI